MASINKLSIRGVRSFSPDDDEQVIEFLFPVTIIVGANGCGKTTVIESLKYAVTGALPPGKNPGQSFVHDPKSIGQSTVKASVKLRFTNAAGNSMVLVRSMELKQNKTKLSFTALDGVLRTTNSDGKRVSMSHKCGELDRQIPLLLGVSKPILEHVVFCHQEDSSWPLMDSSELKKRFDAIFDSTRYTKALKNIDEIKKDYRNKVKDLKADLAGLASHKHAAKGFRKELGTQNEQLEILEEKVDECRQDIKEADKLIEQHNEVITRVEELQSELDEKDMEYQTASTILENHKSYLDEDMTEKHSTRELKDMLRDFEEQTEKRVEAKEDLERDRQKFKDEIDDVGRDANKLMSEQGRLASEKARYEDLLKQRFTKMEKIAGKWGIELAVTQSQSQNNSSFVSQGGNAGDVDNSQDSLLNISGGDMQSFFKALSEKEEMMKQELKEHKARAQEAEDAIQEKLSALNVESGTFEAARQKILDQIKDSQKEQQELSKSHSSGRTRQSEIDDVRRQATQYAKQREDANSDPRKSEIPIELRSYADKIDKLQRSIEEDAAVLQDLQLNATSQNEVSLLKKQIAQEIEGLRESIEDQDFEFSRFKVVAPQFPDEGDDNRGEDLLIAIENLSQVVTEKFGEGMEQLDKSLSNVSVKDRAISEKTALLKHSKQALSANRARVNSLCGEDGSVTTYQRVVAAIRQFADGAGIVTNFDEQDPQTLIAFLDAQLEDLVDMGGDAMAEVGPAVIKRLKNLARVNDDDGALKGFQCPCCLKELEGQEAVTFGKTMKELADPTRSAIFQDGPDLQRDRATRKNFERWRKTVSNGLAAITEHKRLVGESQNLANSMKELESAVSELEQDLVSLKADNADLQSEADGLRQFVDFAKRWVEGANKISSKKISINQKSDDLTMSMTALDTGNRDLDTVTKDLEEKREEKDMLGTKTIKLNKEMTTLNTKVSNYSTSAARLEQVLKEKEHKFKEEQRSTTRKKELNESISKWQEEEKKLIDQASALRPKLRAKETERQRQREHAKEEEEGISDNVSKFSSERLSLEGTHSGIERAAREQDVSNLDSLNANLDKLQGKKKEKEQRIKELEPELERVIRSINDQESHRKLIQGNIELIQMRQRKKELKKAMDSLNEDLAQIPGCDVAAKEFKAAKNRKDELGDAKARLEGRRGGFVEQIHTLKRKLKTPEYKDVDRRHRKAMIMHSTTQAAVGDLEKYHAALDKALLRYHGLKIGEINKIIRELWTLTYKGQDITSIEIVSGQDSGAKTSKSYNYRVVMTKGGSQLDMRGRCSAGQRVLASIVIRLALAETFCLKFGCIALDEPTVNLDYNNKKGLGIALAQIIASRSTQSNFQLVIITHDEEFVNMVKTELSGQTGFSMPDKYFQVRREEGIDNRWYSRIDAVDWDELA